MDLAENIQHYRTLVEPYGATLVAVSKTKAAERIREAYEAGQLDFGENKVQELCDKQAQLPRDIRWHMIGHLQTNKVKYLVPFVHLIHSGDREKLIREINKEAAKASRVVRVLLQVHIAEEDSKFGLSEEELKDFLLSGRAESYGHVHYQGLMGMATLSEDEAKVSEEFLGLKRLFEWCRSEARLANASWETLSMGMSGDFRLALEAGSTMVRVGSAIFGQRD